MRFESIIGFIAIIFITSLFNKDKKSTKSTDRPSRPTPHQTSTKNMPSSDKSPRKSFSGGLGDLFREIKVEFEKNSGGTQERQTNTYTQNDAVKEKSIKSEHKGRSSYTTLEDGVKKVKGDVYKGEIGKSEIPFEFNKKSIIQGVIMSEVLQKPKSLRR